MEKSLSILILIFILNSTYLESRSGSKEEILTNLRINAPKIHWFQGMTRKKQDLAI